MFDIAVHIPYAGSTEDDGPTIVNIDEYKGVKVSEDGIVLSIDNLETTSQSNNTINSSSSVQVSHDRLDELTSSQLSSVSIASSSITQQQPKASDKRKRVDDQLADEIEKQTGKHAFRKSVAAASATSSSDSKTSIDVQAAQLAKQKKEQERLKKQKMLTFDFADE
jgi:hypothetical protein